MEPARLAIEIDYAPATGPYAAVVSLCGEHDLATISQIANALAPLVGDVLVDLSACEFIDSTAILTLLNKAEALKRDGHRLDLFVPAGSPLRRILEILHIRDLLQVHDRRPESPA
ncbi:MAG TPA: STAS domain-containing protein [Microbacteriaceae bacterium]|jgi:anti-anti-sigma factor|nr:STAS domain-containing protein [Microbacteriaceae bacterium]